MSLQRHAPLLVVSAVLVISAVVILAGMQSPKTRPPVPSGAAPEGAALPPDHPPLGVPEEVKESIRQLVAKAEAAPDDLETWKRLGGLQYRAMQVEPAYGAEAEKSFQHILEKAPNDLDALRALGNIAYDRQQPKAAIDYYARYLEKRPDDLLVRTDMGTMYLSTGEVDQAVGIFEEVLQADPKFFQAQINLAIAYHSNGRVDESVAALEKARDLAPDERSRSQVEQLIARVQAPPPVAPGEKPAPAASQAATGAGLQSDVEEIFRANAVMGPKVERIEWTDDATARVYLRDFPMNSMGEEMRAMFLGRVESRLQEKKAVNEFEGRVVVELVDAGSGNVMGTVAQ